MLQRSGRGGARGAVAGAWVCLVLTLLPSRAPAQFARYIDAYNTLARAVNERVSACGVGGPVPLRIVGRGEAFNTLDFEALRFRVLQMLQQGFVLGPESFDLSAADPAAAFPLALRRDGNGDAIGRHLMDGVGDGKGRFTRVAGEYTADGLPVYAGLSWEHPVLWAHFEELRTVLERMRYTLIPEGQYTGWRNPDNSGSQRSGWASSGTWEATRNGVWASYQAGGLTVGVGAPTTCMYGHGASQGFPCSAAVQSRWSRFYMMGLYTGVAHQVTVYLRGAPPLLSPGITYSSVQFDACDSGVLLGQWMEWYTTPGSTAENILSGPFGGQTLAGDCEEPLAGQSAARGYLIDRTLGCVKWDFAPIVLTRPAEAEDTDDDGLCATGCECVGCPPEADPEWKALCTDTRVRFPLGLTSGLQSGGLRLKAYLTETVVNGATQQMYSLGTTVLWSVADATGQNRWEFATVKRPSGAEVMFSLRGADAGAPVESRRKYRLRRDSGYVILSFPASGGQRLREHKFYQGWLAYVTMKVGTTDVVADGSTGYGRWPGLAPAFSGAGLERVDSLAVLAVASNVGGLVRAVELRYKPAGPTNTIQCYHGSRGFRTVDELGRTVHDVRLVEGPDGAVEIWRGITSGAEPGALLKSRRSDWLDATSGFRLLAETTIVHDGRPDADSNVTVTAIAAFPWGDEEVSRTVAYGRPEAQTTRSTYGTDPLDVASYGRLSLQEDPDGNWTAYEYDGRGRERRVRTPWCSSLPAATNACRVTEFFYAGDPVLTGLGYPAETVTGPDDRPRLTVERLGAQEVARRYRAYAADGEIAKDCLNAGAAYDDPDNRTTVTRFLTAWPYAGRPSSVDHPDGTRTVYGYATPGGGLTITEDHGVGAGASITNGTRFVKVLDALERVTHETRMDIASGLTQGATVYTHDGLGRVLCVSNALTGETTVNTYGCCGPENVVDGAGTATTTVYDELKRPYAVERLGVTTFQTYDAGGQVVETRRSAPGEADIVTRVDYDKAGQVRRSIDERGFATTSRVDTNAAGERVVTTCGPDGATAVETYYLDGRVKSISGVGVAPVCYDYGADENGTYTLEYHGADTNAAQWVRTTTDRLGRTRTVTHADGYTQTTEYDALGRVASESDGQTLTLLAQDALGSVSRQALDMDGNGVAEAGGTDRMSETETGYTVQDGRPVRRTVKRAWDTAGSSLSREVVRSLSSVDGSTSWNIAFDRTTRVDVVRNAATAERRETTVAADGTRTVAAYTNGLLVSVWRETAQGSRIATRRQSYDAFGRLARVDDAGPDGSPRVTAYRYDAAGNITNTTVEADGRRIVTASGYDAAGRLAQTTLPDGGVVNYGYEPGGALSSLSGTRAYPVRYGHDEQGRLAWQATYRAGTNGVPDLTRWTYDARRGWPTERVYADGTIHTYEHNPNGSLRRRTSGRGVAVDYGYDPAGAVTNTGYSDGTPRVAIRRDRLGRAVEVSDGTGTRTYDYRADGLVTSETFPLAGERVNWAYDARGRRTNMFVSAGAGVDGAGGVGYDYDAAGRLEHVTQGPLGAGYRYGADGATVVGVTLGTPGGTVLTGTRAYDGFGRVTNLDWTAAGMTVAGFGYGYDAAGWRTNCMLADGRRWAYDYDDRGQVVAARLTSRENTLAAGGQFEYGYDTVGNRTQMQDNGKRTTYMANALNQYTGFDLWGTGTIERVCGTIFTFGSGALGPVTPVVQAGSSEPVRATPAYDADGNLVEMPGAANGATNAGWTYEWDAENRLVQASNAQYRVSFTYDSMGRRVRKVVSTQAQSAWSAVQTNLYLYDGWNVVQEVRSQDSGVSTNGYLWGLDLSGSLQGAGGIGGLVAFSHSSTNSLQPGAYYPSYDANGNVTGMVDTNGTVAASYEYGPFGEMLQATETHEVLRSLGGGGWRFSTRYTDRETGLVMYPRRPYSPTLGRWLSRDPIEEDGGLNLYGFVVNAPVNSVDPLGLALYAFDGTANLPKDESNVSLTHDFGWGGLNKHYEPGIGNIEEYSALTALLRQATGWGLTGKRSAMLEIMEGFLQSGDTDVDIIGFSRGAVTAITFAEVIEKLKKANVSPYCRVDRIRFMGLYDPVPGPFIRHRPGIPGIVQSTSIAYSLDEKRQQFAQSPYSAGVTALGFRGGHSDVGGGYQERGLANISLEWMIDQGHGAGAPFKYPTPSKSPKMVRHQEMNYDLYLYTDRHGLGGIPAHPSVSRLVAGSVNEVVRTPRYGLDVTPYSYYLDSVAPGNDEYRVGDRRF